MRPLDPRVLPHLAPARWPLAGVVAAGLLSGLLLVAQAFAVASLVAGARAGTWGPATTAATWLGAVVLLRGLVSWLGDSAAARAAADVGTSLRRKLVGAALRLGPLALSRRRSGEVALLATRGVGAVEPYLTRYLPALVVAGTLPPLTLLAIATQDRLSALVVLATLPLVPVFAVLVGMTTQDRAERQWRLLAGLSGHFVDVVRGLPTLVAHRRAEAQAASIRAVTHRYREATRETLRLGFASSAVLELVATLSVALVAVTVGLRLSSGSLDLRTALVVLLLAPEAYWPLRRVGAEFHAAAEGTATFEQVDALLTEAPPRPSPDALHRPQTAIALESVTVRYPGRSVPVLDRLSASFPALGVTAVTGPSGCGKSTLLAVLTGDLHAESGTVLVDGIPVTGDTAAAWQRHVAWVPQRPWVAAASVAENVRLARPDAGDAEVWHALERVGLGELVAALPEGLHTVLGEDGTGLSAGQRARLALARVVVSGRPVVLLDEPTAHLDAETERVILDTLKWLGRRCCVVVVAHREAVVDVADHVVSVPMVPAAPAVPVTADPAAIRVEHDPPAVWARAGGATAVLLAPAGQPGRLRRRLVGAMALGALASASGVALTATAGWLIARAAEQPPVLTLMVAIVGVRTFGLARPVLRYAERLLSHDSALALLADRRARVYDLLVPLTPGRLTRHRGDLLASVVDDVDSLLDAWLRVRMPVGTAVLVGGLAAAFATWQLPVAGLVVLAQVAVAGGGAWALGRVGVRRAETAYVAGRAELSAAVVQTLQGAGDVVMWQATGRRLDLLDRIGGEMAAAARRSARAVAAGRAVAVWVAGAALLAVAWYGSAAVAEGRLSAPMLALLLLLPLALAETLTPLADAGALSVRTDAADARLAALAGQAPLVSSPGAPRRADLASPRVTGDGVTAGWGGCSAFRDVAVDLAPGDRVGVVGPSGSGKSTLAAVLLRFLDPAAGTVSLAGVPLAELSLDDVRGTVGLVDDDPHVFASTLRENLRLARPSATDEALWAALRGAALDGWAAGLPRGLDTPLGDGAAHVSGGERARIGLARALLADQPVLVLDEPTAHLDSATARAVARDLLAVPGRSVVWVTHGTVGLDRMDRVLSLAGEDLPRRV